MALALEDPFDNKGMDGIFVDEALSEVEQVGKATRAFTRENMVYHWQLVLNSCVGASLQPIIGSTACGTFLA